MTILHDAAKSGDLPKVRELIAAGHNVNELNEDGHTALYVAAKNNHTGIVAALLEAKADVNLGPLDLKPLNAALANSNIEMLKLIIAARPDFSTKNYSSHFVLFKLIEFGKPSTGKIQDLLYKALKPYQSTGLPTNQQWLIEYMQYLGHNIPNEGVCNGLVLTALQAFLVKEPQRFEDRLQYLRQMPDEKDEFLEQMEKIKNRHLTLLNEVKDKNNLQQLRSLTPSEEELIVNERQVIEQTLTKLTNLLNLSAREVLKRKKQMLFVAFTQKKLNQKLATLPESQQLMLEVPNFFDGVAIYQKLEDKQHLFPTKLLKDQDALRAATLIAPVMSNVESNESWLQQVTSFHGAYSTSDLVDYFESLSKTVNGMKNKQAVRFALASNKHIILVGYDPATDYFHYFDPNNMDRPRIIDSAQRMAELVASSFESYQIENTNLLSTIIYSDESSSLFLQEFAQSWRANAQWQRAHDVKKIVALPIQARQLLIDRAINYDDITTIANLIATDDEPIDRLKFAICIGTLRTIETILASKLDVNKVTKDASALDYAIVKERLDVVERLLNADANPNLATGGSTPLDNAISMKNIGILHLLVERGATLTLQHAQRILTIWHEDELVITISFTEFMRAWKTVFAPQGFDLFQSRQGLAYEIYQQVKRASNDSDRYLVIKSFIEKYPQHRLADELKKIIDVKKRDASLKGFNP